MEDDLLLEELPVDGQEEEPIDPEKETPEGETPAEGDGDKPPVTSLFQADGKKLDPQVSATLANIKKENPELGKLLSSAVYRVAALDREFPGGITEAKELREKVEEFGGVEGIEQKLESLTELDNLAKAYMSGDPAFINDLIESDEAAFNTFAPMIANKYAELNPEGFSAYMARVVISDMQANQVPLLMMRFQDLIPADNAKLKEAFDQINSYLGGFQTLAAKQPATPKARESAGPKKGEDLTKREEELRSREWAAERTTIQREVVNKEYIRCLDGRKPNTEEKAQIDELFQSRSKAAAARLFPGWQAKSERFIKNNDKAGFLRFMKTIYARVTPEAMASSVNATMKGKKPAAPAPGKKPGAQPAAGARTQSDFKPVAKEPDTWQIDWNRTTHAMVGDNRAVLKDGSKVAWR